MNIEISEEVAAAIAKVSAANPVAKFIAKCAKFEAGRIGEVDDDAYVKDAIEKLKAALSITDEEIDAHHAQVLIDNVAELRTCKSPLVEPIVDAMAAAYKAGDYDLQGRLFWNALDVIGDKGRGVEISKKVLKDHFKCTLKNQLSLIEKFGARRGARSIKASVEAAHKAGDYALQDEIFWSSFADVIDEA